MAADDIGQRQLALAGGTAQCSSVLSVKAGDDVLR